MNLDELQIKISIELDDLNKQLKTLTKDIDKALGPKATKKLMADNNKIIKNGLTAINKTTLNLVKKSRKDTTKEIDAMSKDINKSLTKAFDINLTKFNSNITSAMNQARQTVKSACNDIRRELNAALNINGNIRVTSKTTISGSAAGSSGSNIASTMASSQYIGAMIIKATNAVIKDNRTNAKRIESKIDKATSKIVSAVKNIKVDTKIPATNAKVEEKKPRIFVYDPGKVKGGSNKIDSGIFSTKPFDELVEVINEGASKIENSLDEGVKKIENNLNEGASKIEDSLDGLNFALTGGVKDLSQSFKQLKNSVKVINMVNRMLENINKANRFKSLGVGSYGNNQLSGGPINFTQGGTSPLDTSQIEAMKKVHELMKQIRSLGRGIPSDTTSFTYGEVITPQKLGLPIEQLKKAKEIIEDVSYRVLDLETGLMNTSNFDLFGLGKLDTSQVEAMKKAFKDMQNIRKQSRMPRLNEPTEDYNASESMAKELHRQVASLMDMAQELNEAFHKTPMGIDEAVQQANFLEGALDAVLDASKDLTSLSPQIAKGFEFARDVLNQMAPGIRALANEIRSYTKPQAPAGIPMDLEEYDLNPPKPETPKIIEDIRKEIQEEIPINIDTTEAKEKLDKLIKQISEKFDTTLSELFNIDSRALEEGLASLKDWIPTLEKAVGELNQIDDERIKINLDTTDAQNSIEALKTSYEMLIDACKTNNLNAIRDLIPQFENPVTGTNRRKHPPMPPRHSKPRGKRGDGSDELAITIDIDTSSANKVVDKAKKIGKKIKDAIDNSDSQTLGFAPYQNELHELGEAAKRIGAKIKNVFGKVGSNIKGIFKSTGTNLLGDFGKSFDSRVAIHQAGKIKEKLGEIKSSYKKAANEIKKTAKQITEPFKKIASVLKSITGGIKSAWNKITNIFKKGAGEASKATSKLRVELEDILGLAFEFVSLYSLINLGKEAITQSQTLAQSEAKLTSLMRQRMGATNDTVKAIKDLVREQAQLGVVSETAMTRGAEQLSFYLHSAKALETLMPAIANLTAKRGGFNATEDDAEEIATQLGEAIREGTTTPLEQSGIYLTEAEIEKFKHLTTEEARAAYLADVIAKNVGNLNQQLANTPHGAIAQLKNNFKSLLGTLGTLLVNVIQPIVKWLNYIVVAANNALKALGKMLGFDMTSGGLAGVGDVGTGGGSIDTGGIDDTSDAFDNAADSAEKAEEAVEKFKGSLMGFDEINVLSDNTNKKKDDFDPTDITPGEGGQLIPEVGELTEADSIFSKFGDKMKAFMDEILEPFTNAWDLLGDRWMKEWSDLIDSFKHFCDSLGKFLKSVWEHGGKEFVQHLAEIGLACDIAAMEIGGEILDSLARLWDHLDPAKNMNTQGFLNALNEVSVKLRDFILGLGDHFESLMANGGQDVLNALGDMFMNLGEAATRGLGVAIDALDGLIDHLDPANNEITRGMLKAWEDAFHSIGQMALDFVGLLESTLANGGQDVINAIGDLGVQIGKTFGQIVNIAAESMSEFFKHMDPATNKNSEGALEALKYLIDSIRNFVEMLGDSIKVFMDNGGTEFVKNIGDIIAILIELASTIAGDIINTITTFFDSWAGHLVIAACAKSLEIVSGALEILLKILKPLTPLISGVVTAILAFKTIAPVVGFITKIVEGFKLLGGASGILAIAKGAFTALWGVIAANPIAAVVAAIVGIGTALVALYNKCDWFRDAVNTIFDKFKDMFKGLIDVSKDIIEKIVNVFKGFVDILVGIFTGDGEKVGKAVRDIVENIYEIFRGIVDFQIEIAKIGFDLISNFCKGIWDAIKKIPDALDGIADFFIDYYVGLFGLDSSVGEEIKQSGKELMTGFCQGIKDKISAVGEVFNEVKETVSDAISSITSKEWWQGIGENIKNTFDDICTNVSNGWNTIKDATVETCGNVWNTVKDKFSSVAEVISDTVGNWVDIVSEKWAKVTEPIAENLSVAISNASEKWTKLKEELSGILDDFIQRNKDRWERIKSDTHEKIAPIVDDVVDKYSKMKDSVSDTLDEWAAISEEKWGAMKEKIMDKVQPLIDKVIELYDGAKNHVTNAWEVTKDAAIKAWDETAKFFDTHKTHLENKMSELSDYFGEVWDKIKKTAKDDWEEVVKTFDTHKEHLKEKISILGDHFKDMWGYVKKEAEKDWEAIVDLFDTHKKHLEEKMTAIANHFEKAWKATKKAAKEAWDETVDLFNTHKTHLENKMTELGDYLGKVWGDVKKTAKDDWDEIVKAFDTHKTHLEKRMAAIGKYFKNIWKDTKETTIDVWDDIEKWFGTHWENLKDIAETAIGHISDAWKSISKAAEEVWVNIKDSIAFAFNGIVDFFADIFSPVLDWFKEFGKKIVDALAFIPAMFKDLFEIDVFGGIKEGLGNGLDKLKQGGELLEKAISIGRFLVEGLFDGIMTTAKLIGTFLSGVGDIIIGFFKDLFGIHSPSTVFAELGVYLIEGLIEGITSMLGSIGDTFTNLKDSVVGWVKDIVDEAIEKWGELKESITTNLGELYNNVSDKWQEIKENVSEKCKDIYEDTKEKWTNIKDNVSETISNLKDDASDKYNKLKDTLTDTMDKWRQNSEEKWSKIKDKTSDLVSKLKSDTEDKYNKFKEALTNTMEKWRSNSEEKWTKIKDKTNDLTTKLRSEVEERYTKFKDKLTDTMESWRSNSEDKWTKVKNKTSELVSNLKQDIEDRYTKFKDKLTDTMETWRSNNEDRWSKIKNKTSELVSNLKSDTETKYNTMKENLTSKLETFRQTSVDKWEDIKVKAGESINNLKKDVESKYETLKNNLTNKLETWRSTSESKWNDIKEKGVSAIENIRKNGEEKFESLKTSVISKMESIRSNLETKWNDVKNKATSAISTMKSDVENKYNELKTNICAKLEEVKSEANSKWESIKTTAGTKAREVVTEATNKFAEIKSSFTSKMDEAKKALEPKWTELKNSVKTNASGIASKVSEGLSTVKQKFTKPFEDAQRAVVEVINSIGRTFSNANWSFPKIKLPHIKVTGEWSFNPPRVPSFGIEWRKRGGIIDGITPIGFANGALQMGGEAGKEMVVPLENTSFTSKIAQAMGQAVDNAMARNMNSMYGSSANNSNDSKDIVLKVNERELARASINSINKLQRESGRTLLDI